MLVEGKSSLSSSSAGARVAAVLGMTVGTSLVDAVNVGATVDWEMGTGNPAIECGETRGGVTTAEIDTGRAGAGKVAGFTSTSRT